MMKKVLYAFLAACVLAGCTTSSPVEPALKAQILCMTADATSITHSSVELNGTASIRNASSESAESYFYYSANGSDAETVKATGTKVPAGQIAGTGGDFSCELNDLEPSSTYYYVASVAIDGQESLGSVRSFTTKAAPLTMTGAVDNNRSLPPRFTDMPIFPRT